MLKEEGETWVLRVLWRLPWERGVGGCNLVLGRPCRGRQWRLGLERRGVAHECCVVAMGSDGGGLCDMDMMRSLHGAGGSAVLC